MAILNIVAVNMEHSYLLAPPCRFWPLSRQHYFVSAPGTNGMPAVRRIRCRSSCSCCLPGQTQAVVARVLCWLLLTMLAHGPAWPKTHATTIDVPQPSINPSDHLQPLEIYMHAPEPHQCACPYLTVGAPLHAVCSMAVVAAGVSATHVTILRLCCCWSCFRAAA